MAFGDPYITRPGLKSRMDLDDSTEHDAYVDEVIAAVTTEVREHCGRDFNDSGSVSARRYRPRRPDEVFIHDFHTTAGLIVQTDDDDDGVFETTWVEGTDFELHPLDGIHNGVPGWPYNHIVAVGGKRFRFSFRANLRVSARWGWAAVPDLVKTAAYILGQDTFQLRDSRLGIAGSDAFGSIVRVKDNPLVANKLKHFVRGSVHLG